MNEPRGQLGRSDEGRGGRWAIALGAVALVALVAVVAGSPARLIHDEVDYQRNVVVLREVGLGREFLAEMLHPAGPLYPVIHWLAYPLTKAQAPAVRFVTVIAFGSTALIVACLAKQLGIRDWKTTGVGLFAAAIVWKVAGMALTEVPAMLALVAGIALLHAAVYGPRNRVACELVSVAAGLVLSAAILGRQPLLVVVLASLLLLRDRDVCARRLVVACVVAFIAPIYVFSVWGGLVPTRGVHETFRTAFVVSKPFDSATYLSTVPLLLTPSWFFGRQRSLLGVPLVCGAVALAIGARAYVPGRSVIRALGLAEFSDNAGVLVGGVWFGIGVWFIWRLLVMIYVHRDDAFAVFLFASVVLLLGVTARMSNRVSSRYVVTSVPLLILALARTRVLRPLHAVVGTALGAAVGLGLLILRLYAK